VSGAGSKPSSVSPDSRVPAILAVAAPLAIMLTAFTSFSSGCIDMSPALSKFNRPLSGAHPPLPPRRPCRCFQLVAAVSGAGVSGGTSGHTRLPRVALLPLSVKPPVAMTISTTVVAAHWYCMTN
jgi:hypothetical protein